MVPPHLDYEEGNGGVVKDSAVELVLSEVKNEVELFTVTVYAASSANIHEEFFKDAYELGKLIANENWVQVNGGGATGLMGAVTDGGSDHGGIVDGVILDMFVSTNQSSKLREVVVSNNMPDRKKGLFDRADAIVVLPGGLGTLEEISEVLSWRQLGFHTKPVVFLNTMQFYTALETFLKHAIDTKFVHPKMNSCVEFVDSPKDVIKYLKTHKPEEISKEALHRVKTGTMEHREQLEITVNSDWTAAEEYYRVVNESQLQ